MRCGTLLHSCQWFLIIFTNRLKSHLQLYLWVDCWRSENLQLIFRIDERHLQLSGIARPIVRQCPVHFPSCIQVALYANISSYMATTSDTGSNLIVWGTHSNLLVVTPVVGHCAHSRKQIVFNLPEWLNNPNYKTQLVNSTGTANIKYQYRSHEETQEIKFLQWTSWMCWGLPHQFNNTVLSCRCIMHNNVINLNSGSTKSVWRPGFVRGLSVQLSIFMFPPPEAWCFRMCLSVSESECESVRPKHLVNAIYTMRYNTNIHRVSKKPVQNCFCQNFVKFPPILIFFGRKMVERLKLCEVHSFSSSPNLRHHTTVF